MNELPNKHSAIVNAAASPELARLDKEVDIANKKAIPVLRALDKISKTITNGYDSRFDRLLTDVIRTGDSYGGFVSNWTSGMKKIHKEMTDELSRRK